MAASDAAMYAVAENALRHLIEAEQHFKAGRYPSATASAILSFEEVGKLTFLASGHAAAKKHAANGQLAVCILMVFEGHDFRAEWTKLRDREVSIQSLSPEYLQAIREQPDYAAFIRRVEAGEFKDADDHRAAWATATATAMTRGWSDALAGRFTIPERTKALFAKGLQQLRLRATYVDVDRSGENWTDPKDLTEDVAKGLCVGAAVILDSMCKTIEISGRRSNLSLADVANAIPRDLISLDISLMSRLFASVLKAATD